MTDTIDTTIKLLVDEGRKRGFLTHAEMNKLLEDQFLPPDKLEQVFIGLEEAGVDVIEDGDADLTTDVTAGRPRHPARHRRRREGRGRGHARRARREDRRPGPHVPDPDG